MAGASVLAWGLWAPVGDVDGLSAEYSGCAGPLFSQGRNSRGQLRALSLFAAFCATGQVGTRLTLFYIRQWPCRFSTGATRSGEALDYAFAVTPRYAAPLRRRPRWPTSWSTRGQTSSPRTTRILEPVANARARAAAGAHRRLPLVRLGRRRVELGVGRRARRGPERGTVPRPGARRAARRRPRPRRARRARARAPRRARARGARTPQLHVVLAFPHVPLPLDEMYMHKYVQKCARRRPRATASRRARSAPREWSAFIDGVAGALAAEPALAAAVTSGGRDIVDLRADLTRAAPRRSAATTAVEDHLPDYTKTQHVFAARVAALALENDDERAGPLARGRRRRDGHVREAAARCRRSDKPSSPWWPPPGGQEQRGSRCPGAAARSSTSPRRSSTARRRRAGRRARARPRRRRPTSPRLSLHPPAAGDPPPASARRTYDRGAARPRRTPASCI